MDHEKEDMIQKLKIERELLLKVIDCVDVYIDKLSLEQDQIKVCLQEAVDSTKPGCASPVKAQNSQSTQLYNKPLMTLHKSVYTVVNDEEENIEAINSQPLTLDLDLDEFLAPPEKKVKFETKEY